MQTTIYSELPEEVLRKAFVDLRGRNPAYSLRALARDMGVSHTYLSLALNGKRKLSAKQVFNLAQLLELSAEQTTSLLKSCPTSPRKKTKREKNANANFVQMELDRYRILTDWYHLPLLDLTLTQGFVSDPQWVAQRLGISQTEVKHAVKRLERLGLLSVKDGKWKKSDVHITFPTQRSMSAVRKFHRKMISLAIDALDSPADEDFAMRDISGITIAVDPARMPEAKKRIQKFRRSMDVFLSEGKPTELYQINIQLFPLSKPVSKFRRGKYEH